MGDILTELIGYSSHEILGLAKCDKRSPSDKWDKWLLLISSEGKNWDKDPRPPGWDSLGWSVLVKRPASPSKDVRDTKKYTTLKWDAVGMTVSKVTVTLNPNSTPDESPIDTVNSLLLAPPRDKVAPNGSKTNNLPSGKKKTPIGNSRVNNKKNNTKHNTKTSNSKTTSPPASILKKPLPLPPTLSIPTSSSQEIPSCSPSTPNEMEVDVPDSPSLPPPPSQKSPTPLSAFSEW